MLIGMMGEPKFPFFACLPDGLASDNIVIEIKS